MMITSALIVLVFTSLGVFADYNCPTNYTYYGDGNCYKLIPTPVRKAEGQAKCQQDNATLSIIKSSQQNDIVTRLSQDNTVVTWLGITCTSNTYCQWDDGSAITYKNFENGRPDVSRGQCAFINVASGKEGTWTSADCQADFKAVICQRPPYNPVTCPSSFIKGSDQRCYYAPNIQLLFSDAEDLCSDTSSFTYITSISDSDENAAVQLIAAANHFSTVYIGLKYGPSGYEWVDGTTFGYNNFANGQPDNRIGSCVVMNVTSGQWMSVNCNQQLSFVCLKEYNGPVTSTTTLAPSQCPTNNNYYGPNLVSSPNYPNYYGGSIECSYILNVASGVVTLRFYDFELKNTDWIELYEGSTDYTLLYRLQGTVSTSQWFSTRYSNSMLVRFVSKPGTANVKGWDLYFKPDHSVSAPPTTSTMRTTTTSQSVNVYYGAGTISSPNYPNLYPNNLNITYIMQATPGNVIRLTFNKINTERCCDVITVYDGRYEDDSKVIVSLSGDHSDPETYQSNGTYMTVRFLTDAVLEEDGFTADFVSYNNGGSTPKLCQDGWTHDSSQQYCYKYFANGGPWFQNLQACTSSGAQLLTIHNAAQETFIKNFVFNAQMGTTSTVTWIGLHYGFDDWGWSDGTALTYKDWLSGEPSIAGDCAAIQAFSANQGWTVRDCDTVLPYICYHTAFSK